MKLLNIYFAASIRAGREDAPIYQKIIEHLGHYGRILTEHVGDPNLHKHGEKGLSDKQIHDRDLEWVLESDVIIAEVTTPSLGVGYETGRGVENNKKILCLYRPQEDKKLSGMISGCDKLTRRDYQNIDQAKVHIDEFFKKEF